MDFIKGKRKWKISQKDICIHPNFFEILIHMCPRKIRSQPEEVNISKGPESESPEI